MKNLVLSAFFLFGFLAQAFAQDEVVVYSERKEHLIAPLFERFTQQTGIPVRYITDKAGVLIERIAAEGQSTPADILMTVDAGNLWQAKQRGVLRSNDSALLQKNVPESLRDPENYWFGLSQRARTIVYSTERIKPSELSSYEALGEANWKGRLCLRTSKKVYNQSLVATLIERLGKKKTTEVLESWVANLAAPVFSNDTLLLEAIAAGQCDVGIVNTYYLGRVLNDKPDFPVTVFWPNQTHGGGVHVNISGAGVVKSANNISGATRLLEWLSGPEAQKDFAGINLEYPILAGIPVHKLLQKWGEFKADPVNLTIAGARQREAVQLMDRAGYR